jgi:hypothetical protein
MSRQQTAPAVLYQAVSLNQCSGALPKRGDLLSSLRFFSPIRFSSSFCFRLFCSSIFWLSTTFAIRTRAVSYGARFKLLSGWSRLPGPADSDPVNHTTLGFPFLPKGCIPCLGWQFTLNLTQLPSMTNRQIKDIVPKAWAAANKNAKSRAA